MLKFENMILEMKNSFSRVFSKLEASEQRK